MSLTAFAGRQADISMLIDQHHVFLKDSMNVPINVACQQ
jgi:hypothetical protein